MASKLRIVVPVKRVLDYTLKPRINATKTAFDNSGLKTSINPFCEIAVEEAVQMRKRYADRVEDITAVSIGPPKSSETLRTALAMGCDRSIHVKTVSSSETCTIEPLSIAKILKEIVKSEKANLVILGKQSVDDDYHQTGQILAGLLKWPQATCASKIEIDSASDKVTVEREIEGGVETLELSLPAVVTTDLRLNKPGYVALGALMKAKKKPITEKSVSDFPNVDTSPRLEILQVEEPPKRKGGLKVKDVSEMVAKLKELGAI